MTETEARACTENGENKMIENKHLTTAWTTPAAKHRSGTGAQDAYQTGDKVHYPTAEDQIWISTADNNVWQPGVYGWEIYNN